ncbi:hypothetical protein LCGC14_1516660, partial [marine sediment metagenome]
GQARFPSHLNGEMNVKKQDAIQFQEAIEKLCLQNDVWCNTIKKKEPYLKFIEMKLSIKIDPPTTKRSEG